MQHRAVTYPAAFGHWHLRGGTLQCRLPRKTVEVSAPAALLVAVARLCDGRLAWRDVAAELARRWDERAVDGFLRGLCTEGLIVESDELLAHWTELGHGQDASNAPAEARACRSPAHAVGHRAATPALDQIHLPAKAATLAHLLRERRTWRTFADEPLPARVLRSIVWAAAGVTPIDGLSWFVFVLRELPDGGEQGIAPGAYEALLPAGRNRRLSPVSGDVHAAWRILRDARVLQFASAILLPVADARASAARTGNRGTLLSHVAAGESLQNAQLMACALGAAGVVRGDIRAAQVRQLAAAHIGTRTGPLLPMPVCVVGSKPSAAQARLQESEQWLSIEPAASSIEQGKSGSARHAWIAGPFPTVAGDIRTMGRSADPRVALVKAEAEAWERLGWLTLSEGRRGRMADVTGAIDPRRLVAYSPRQHTRPGFPFPAFDDEREYLWIRGRDVLTGQAIHVPAEHVHAHAALPPDIRDHALTACSTSGMAAGTDEGQALQRATLELVERDAFLRSWIGGRPIPVVARRSLPAQARDRIRRLEREGVRVAVIRLPVDLAPTFAVFVQRTDPPLTGITAAADFDAESALHKALDEAESRSRPIGPAGGGGRRRGTPQDIHRHWQLPHVFRRADWYAASAERETFGRPALAACAGWQALLASLRAQGRDLYAIDVTPPGASIHQGRTPLRVLRAFMPGTLPIWFQQGLEPAGMPAYAIARALRTDGRGARSAVPLHPFD